MHQSFETPAHPPFGLERGIHFLYASESEWSPRFPETKVSGVFPRPYFSTHGTPFQVSYDPHSYSLLYLLLPSVTHWLKNTVGSHETNIDLWAASK